MVYLYRLFSKSLDTGDAFHVVLRVPVAKQLLNPLNELLTDWGGQQGHHIQDKRKYMQQQVLNRNQQNKMRKREPHPLQMEYASA